MRIGILGGSFDPPHNGHVALAHAAAEQLKLDEVIFVPVRKNPLKRGPVASAKDRLEMVRLALQDETGLSVSDVETSRAGPSYAIDTLVEFTMVRPAEYWFLVGADALRDLSEWKEPQKLLDHCRFGVVARDHLSPEKMLATDLLPYSRRIDVIVMKPDPVSSTLIRNDIARGLSVEAWLKPAVWEYIRKVGLYKQ
ncbi:MAG: nicotinate (nicotinamide) nucleotide adenylyltransferase [Armatimonadetes bacterium]|nr:nicotinate (nicotinamide) nucleotide adenylyltransferase [Armatimonadota bacterium]